ncbi:tetratricopeptide repeat protein [Parapedobacter indicus]|uniref:Uncharacterized protein n=1 Tax=Parapedobacter indicus TaxID=1477437 RepID=A0A1I3JD79_9SPHI|nr:hypothetical protein [Parapedobacter indicus]PPL02465.1 hypothetical protein CLV26_104395 [Parapedobacter indicus]SFI57885.1 hypothetical protein SAMN05444682_104394 [Parapedobacter indicus]
MIKADPNDKTLITELLAESFEKNLSVNYIIRQDEKKAHRLRVLMEYSIKMCSHASADPDILRTLSIAYYNWANNTVQKANIESQKKRDSMIRNAIQRYELAIQTDPSFDRPYLNKGTAMLRQAQDKNMLTDSIRKEILGLFEKAISLNATSYETWSNSARLILELGNELLDSEQRGKHFEESIRRYNRALDLYPHDVNVYRNLAWLYKRLAEHSKEKSSYFEQSISYYEKAITLDPSVESNLALATALGEYAELRVEKGGDLLRRAISLLIETEASFGTSSDINYRLGNKYLILAKLEKDNLMFITARTHLQMALELDSSNVRAMNNLGHCELTIAVNEENPEIAHSVIQTAKSRLEKVLQLDPNHKAAWSNLGYVDMELAKRSSDGDRIALLESAITNLKKANEFDPDSVIYDLARAYALLGNQKVSIKYLHDWLTKGNNWSAASFTEDFENVKDVPDFKFLTEQLL